MKGGCTSRRRQALELPAPKLVGYEPDPSPKGYNHITKVEPQPRPCL